MTMASPPATADELRDLLVQIVGAYDDLAEAELERPQGIAVLEAVRAELHQCIDEAAKITGAQRRRRRIHKG